MSPRVFSAFAALSMLALPVGAQEEPGRALESLRIAGNRAIPAEKILADCAVSRTGRS